MKELKSLAMVDCEPWTDGLKIQGLLVRVDTIKNCPSRKIILDSTGNRDYVACWETASLKGFTEQLRPGDYVRITCLGQRKVGKNTMWDFKVEIAESDSEIVSMVR